MHDVDSSEQAFKTAGSMAFSNVFQQARPGLLEPIVKIEITVPSSKVGDITSDLSGRRAASRGWTPPAATCKRSSPRPRWPR